MRDMAKGLLIIFSGPSGVGKGTVRKELFKRYPDLNLTFSISLTTREPRNGEIDGIDYYFVSKDYFNNAIREDKLLEHCEFVGNCYGTPKDKVEELRNQGKNVFLEIEINGATQVMNATKGDDGVLSIFLVPPSLEALEKRITLRKSETPEIIKERLEKARHEMSNSYKYNFVVTNHRVNKAANDIARIIINKLKVTK